MRSKSIIAAPLLLIALTACAPSPDTHSSRFEGATLSFAAQPSQMNAQAVALAELSKRIVVQTTLKGAGIGAAVGCGFAVVSAGSASNCVAAAAAGAATGAVVGHIKGKQKVARQIEKISPSNVVRTLRKTNEQMALVRSSLPARLAAQEQMLSQLEMQRATGAIDQDTYVSARTAIADERRALAQSLTQTETHATQAAANLAVAKSEGQKGLDWHIAATSKLKAEAESARSSISLL